MTTKAVSVISWRGGVGKSTFCMTLASILAQKGKVLLVEADFHAPNLLNELPIKKSSVNGFFRDFLRGFKSLEEIVHPISTNSSTIHVIFSNPHVNLWEMQDDVGNLDYWAGTGTINIDERMEIFKDFVYQTNVKYVLFDLMGGIYYPSLYFSHLSHYTILLSRPSIPQVEHVASMITRLGKKCHVVWSNVPNQSAYMEDTRKMLESFLDSQCGNLHDTLGFIPHDPTLEYQMLKEGFVILEQESTMYFNHVKNLVKELGL